MSVPKRLFKCFVLGCTNEHRSLIDSLHLSRGHCGWVSLSKEMSRKKSVKSPIRLGRADPSYTQNMQAAKGPRNPRGPPCSQRWFHFSFVLNLAMAMKTWMIIYCNAVLACRPFYVNISQIIKIICSIYIALFCTPQSLHSAMRPHIARGTAHFGGLHSHRLTQRRRQAIGSILQHCTNQWMCSFTGWLKKLQLKRRKWVFPIQRLSTQYSFSYLREPRLR